MSFAVCGRFWRRVGVCGENKHENTGAGSAKAFIHKQTGAPGSDDGVPPVILTMKNRQVFQAASALPAWNTSAVLCSVWWLEAAAWRRRLHRRTQQLLGPQVLLSVGFVPQKLLHLRQDRRRQLWENLQKKQRVGSTEELRLLFGRFGFKSISPETLGGALVRACVRACAEALTCTARMFSASCSVLEAPSRTALTPSFLRHQAVEKRVEVKLLLSALCCLMEPHRWPAGAESSPDAGPAPAAPSASPAGGGPPHSGSCPSSTGNPDADRKSSVEALQGPRLARPMWAQLTFREAREQGGIPVLYFPEMIPQARGDQVMAPIPASRRGVSWSAPRCEEGGFPKLSIFSQKHSPILWDSSGSWTSTFSLWNMWYSACSQMGGIWLNCRATEYASFNQQGQPSQPRSLPQEGVCGPTHHDLHGAPSGGSPVHGHSLVDHVGHGPDRLFQDRAAADRRDRSNQTEATPTNVEATPTK